MNSTSRPDSRPRIFVSYRREDTEMAVGRLVDDLRTAFPRATVFRDWESICPGEDFVAVLESELAKCVAALVVIGPRWLSAADATGNCRLYDPNDWVCREISECLSREGVRVFPLLLEGVRMPVEAELPDSIRRLVQRQAHPITTRHWAKDVGTLIEALSQVPQLERAVVSRPPTDKRWSLTAGAVALSAIGLGFVTLKGIDLNPVPPLIPPSTDHQADEARKRIAYLEEYYRKNGYIWTVNNELRHLYSNFDNEKSFEQADIILMNEPMHEYTLDTLSKFQIKSDTTQAITNLLESASMYPSLSNVVVASFIKAGDLSLRAGRVGKAKQYYDKAQTYLASSDKRYKSILELRYSDLNN